MKRSISLLSAVAVFMLAPGAVQAQSHFTGCSTNTGSDATIVLPTAANPTIDGDALATGDEIAVFTTDGMCAGLAVWTETNTPLTAWGDNLFTAKKDGFAAGEPLSFKVWDASTETEYAGLSVTVTFSSARPYYHADAQFVENGLYVIESLQVTAAPELNDAATIKRPILSGEQGIALEQNFPNPFNTSTTISYALPENAEVRLEVFDTQGASVGVLATGQQAAGRHEIVLDASHLMSGVYLYRLTADGHTTTRRMHLVR